MTFSLRCLSRSPTIRYRHQTPEYRILRRMSAHVMIGRRSKERAASAAIAVSISLYLGACSLLQTGELPVLEAALAVGYNSLSSFHRQFRRIYGCSPTEYLRRTAPSEAS